MYEKLQQIRNLFGLDVANRVYEHYDTKRVKQHLPNDTTLVLKDIESPKTYVGSLELLRKLYPKFYPTKHYQDYTTVEEVEADEIRWKDYQILHTDGKDVVAEIFR